MEEIKRPIDLINWFWGLYLAGVNTALLFSSWAKPENRPYLLLGGLFFLGLIGVSLLRFKERD